MLVTINTDASYNHFEKVGSFAYWIVCDQGVIKRSGVFKESPVGSSDAELKCICNALHALHVSPFSGVSRIIINSDAMATFSVMNRPHKIKKGSVASKFAGLLDNIKKKYNIPQEKKMHEFRHVKAHTDSRTGRALVNKWCDKEAKKALRKAVKLMR